MHQKILILDFGAQYTQLIARRVREARVYCEIHPYDVSDQFVREFGARGVILSGSHMSVTDDTAARVPQAVFDLGVPVLGICYGMQTMAGQLGGVVEAGTVREFGYAEVRARGHTRLLDGIEDFRTPEGYGMLKVWMSHGDKVTRMPAGFKLMASTDSCPIAAMADEERGFYAVQFHPEVTHTLQGTAILKRFVNGICGCAGDWNMPDYASEAIARVREQVGQDEVILGLSGGVDSSVAAVLATPASVLTDSGWAAIAISAHNTQGFPTWVSLTPAASGQPAAATFGYVFECTVGACSGSSAYLYIFDDKIGLDAGGFRQYVFDLQLPSGRYSVRGFFNVDTTQLTTFEISP